LAALLHGLKRYPERTDLTAVVTVTDDGGSSGRLRRDFDVLPPGDIRNCMVALAEDETLLTRLFQYRFKTGRGLKGHSFGNLFLTALTDVTGDFAKAVRLSSAVLPIQGRIFPSTAANVQLEAELENGRRVAGETRISKSRSPIAVVRLKPRRCKPMKETLQAIEEADLISFGPGSLYTSVIPNLLVEGIPAAVRRSRAVKAYFVNLMWQPGETMHYTAADHVKAIEKHAGKNLLDYVIVNTRPVSTALRRKYGNQQVSQVENDLERLAGMGLAVVARDLLEEKTTVRHNPALAAEVAVQLAQEGRRGRGRG
jgi:uncharacterized cofD-like protein